MSPKQRGALVNQIDGEKFKLLARGIKEFYEALIKEGFDPEQAIQIVAAQGIGPGIPSEK